MDCGQIQTLFTAYRDQELDPQNSSLFENHLVTCSHCRREWSEFLKIIQHLEAVPSLPPPPDLLVGIHEKLEHLTPGWLLRRVLTKIFSPLPLTAAASGMAAILLITIVSGTGSIPGFGSGSTSSLTQSEPRNRISSANQPAATALPPALLVDGIDGGGPQARTTRLLPPMAFTPPVLPVHHLERESSGRHPYYHSLLTLEQVNRAHDYLWRHPETTVHNSLDRDSRKPRIGTPLRPDITIRINQLTPRDLDRLHGHIQRSGNWQTRCYHLDYLLVLINPGELETLYNLLEHHRLPFSAQLTGTAEPSSRQSLLVAIRP